MSFLQREKAITALRERLAQPEQTLNLDPTPISGWGRQSVGMSIPKTEPAQPEQSPLDRMAENARELGLDYEPVQEPVAWGIANTRPTESKPLMMVMLDEPPPSHLVIPLYATPPRQWVGLTDDEIALICAECSLRTPCDIYYARAIEAKLREKNQ